MSKYGSVSHSEGYKLRVILAHLGRRLWRTQIPEEEAMLILTRRIGEKIRIGDEVALVVLGIKGRSVRIGITAPKSIPVHREEIYDRIRRELAAQKTPTLRSRVTSAA
jgi:carbon storage regulator